MEMTLGVIPKKVRFGRSTIEESSKENDNGNYLSVASVQEKPFRTVPNSSRLSEAISENHAHSGFNSIASP